MGSWFSDIAAYLNAAIIVSALVSGIYSESEHARSEARPIANAAKQGGADLSIHRSEGKAYSISVGLPAFAKAVVSSSKSPPAILSGQAFRRVGPLTPLAGPA